MRHKQIFDMTATQCKTFEKLPCIASPAKVLININLNGGRQKKKMKVIKNLQINQIHTNGQNILQKIHLGEFRSLRKDFRRFINSDIHLFQ